MVRMIAGALISETLISGTDLGRHATDPTPTGVGDGYYNTTFNYYKYWNGTAWVTEPITVVVNPTVTWNPSASPLSVVLKDWNRGFEKGNLDEWTPTNAEISTVQPHTGSYCCKLTATGSKIVQTLDDPVPVLGVWLIRVWGRSATGTNLLKVTMNHSDGTVNEFESTIFPSAWQDYMIPPSMMSRDKFLSGITIESSVGEIYVDTISLILAPTLVTGSVEVALLQPISKGSIFNTAIGANANFFAANLAPTKTPTLFRIYVCLSVAGVFNVRRTHGGVTVTENMNGPTGALTANAAYIFDTLVDAGDTINLRTTVAATIIKCSVVEKDNVE